MAVVARIYQDIPDSDRNLIKLQEIAYTSLFPVYIWDRLIKLKKQKEK